MIEGRAKLQSNANFQRRSQTMHDDDEKHNFSWEAKENWIFKPFYRQKTKLATLFYLNYYAKNQIYFMEKNRSFAVK